MPAIDPARQLARELNDLRREVRSASRGSQAAHRSLEVDGTTVALPDVVREGRAAQEKATISLATANGKNSVTFSTNPADPATPGNTPGDIWFQKDIYGLGAIVGQWEWTGSAWEPRQIHDNIIANLTVGKLVTGEIAAGQRIIAGPENGTHAEMADSGFRVFASDPTDGIPNEVIRLGTDTDDYFAIVNADGSLAASVDQSGYGSFSGVSTKEWPDIGAVDHTGQGGTLLEILDRRPRGLVIYGTSASTFSTNTAGGIGTFEVRGRLFFGRIYRIGVRCRLNATTTDNIAEVQIRYARGPINGGSEPPVPTINSTIAGRLQIPTTGAAHGVAFDKLISWGVGASPADFYDARFLLTFSRPSGTGTVTMFGTAPDQAEIWIEDIGPFVQDAAVPNNGGGGSVASAPQKFSKTYAATWTQSFKGDNSLMTNSGGQAYQGRDPSGFNGIQKAYIGFPDMTADLAGATIEDVGVYLYANHWYNNSGGTALIGAHGHLNPPGSYSSGQEAIRASAGWPKPGGRWVSLGPSQAWVTGTYRGILLGGPTGTDLGYYGRFNGAGQPEAPLINITYRK